jgi:hypothetical protein
MSAIVTDAMLFDKAGNRLAEAAKGVLLRSDIVLDAVQYADLADIGARLCRAQLLQDDEYPAGYIGDAKAEEAGLDLVGEAEGYGLSLVDAGAGGL